MIWYNTPINSRNQNRNRVRLDPSKINYTVSQDTPEPVKLMVDHYFELTIKNDFKYSVKHLIEKHKILSTNYNNKQIGPFIMDQLSDIYVTSDCIYCKQKNIKTYSTYDSYGKKRSFTRSAIKGKYWIDSVCEFCQNRIDAKRILKEKEEAEQQQRKELLEEQRAELRRKRSVYKQHITRSIFGWRDRFKYSFENKIYNLVNDDELYTLKKILELRHAKQIFQVLLNKDHNNDRTWNAINSLQDLGLIYLIRNQDSQITDFKFNDLLYAELNVNNEFNDDEHTSLETLMEEKKPSVSKLISINYKLNQLRSSSFDNHLTKVYRENLFLELAKELEYTATKS